MKILRSIFPHALSIAGGAFLVILFFSPMFFEGKTLKQHDIRQGVAAGREIQEFRASNGSEGLWTNSMFGGMPAYLINIYWSGELTEYVQKVISFNMPPSAQVIFLSFLGFYVLLLSFGLSSSLAFAGAIAYAFNTFNLVSVEAGHIWKVRAIAYMPLVVAGVHLVFTNTKKWLGAGLLSLAIALEIKANHLQITYYLFIFMLVYGGYILYTTYKEKSWNSFFPSLGILIICVILGIGANFGRLWSTAEYSKYSTRGASDLTKNTATSGEKGLEKEYVFNWSYGIGESLTLLIPNFAGGATTETLSSKSNLGKALLANGVPRSQVDQQLKRVPTYWGDQPFTSGPTYAGAVLFFLFILSLLTVKSTLRNWLLLTIILSLLLAWGKNLAFFNDLMYAYFPGYNKFRSVSMAMAILLLALPLLSFLALNTWIQLPEKERKNKLIRAGLVTGGTLFLLFLFSQIHSFRAPVDSQMGQVPEWYVQALRADRSSMMARDVVRTFLFSLLGFTLCWYFLQNRLQKKYLFLGIGALIVTDMLLVGRRFISEENYETENRQTEFVASAANQRILRDADPQARVVNLLNPWNESETSAFHHSVGGYHGAKMKRYMELIDNCLSSEVNAVINDLQNSKFETENYALLNMLNTRYFKFGDQASNVLENKSAWGPAWFASEIIAVNNADEELTTLCSGIKKGTIIVDASRFAINQTHSGNGTIELIQHSPSKLQYKISSETGGIAALSEVYYPEGWEAFVDGKKVEIIRANYILRAVDLPPGDHELVLTFKPKVYILGNSISLIFSSLVLLLFIVSLVMQWRKAK